MDAFSSQINQFERQLSWNLGEQWESGPDLENLASREFELRNPPFPK